MIRQTVYSNWFPEVKNRAKLESHGASDYSSSMAGDGNTRFPSTMRLKKKTEFIRVFREGSTWKGSYFSLHVLPRGEDVLPLTGDVLLQKAEGLPSQESGARLGIVVTRKDGSAVERNRIKRKIREAFRKMVYRLPVVDLVIRPNAVCKEAPEEEISRSLERAVKEALENVKERT